MIYESAFDMDILTETSGPVNFEEVYINIRQKEQRIYTNEEVALLPGIYPDHIHYHEWQIRKRSSERLINYLDKKNKPLKILEIGCGNGWLSAKMADVPNSKVTGLDINLTELKQAFEVFDKPNLSFIYGDIHDSLRGSTFDIIVFAASIQYFPSLKEIISKALLLLNPGGEIHILDTPFYENDEVENAIERTKKYYTGLGHPEMATHYFHHNINELKNFKHEFLSRGDTILNKLLRKNDPFPWIRINK